MCWVMKYVCVCVCLLCPSACYSFSLSVKPPGQVADFLSIHCIPLSVLICLHVQSVHLEHSAGHKLNRERHRMRRLIRTEMDLAYIFTNLSLFYNREFVYIERGLCLNIDIFFCPNCYLSHYYEPSVSTCQTCAVMRDGIRLARRFARRQKLNPKLDCWMRNKLGNSA